jgi:hypothetical protein
MSQPGKRFPCQFVPAGGQSPIPEIAHRPSFRELGQESSLEPLDHLEYLGAPDSNALSTIRECDLIRFFCAAFSKRSQYSRIKQILC